MNGCLNHDQCLDKAQSLQCRHHTRVQSNTSAFESRTGATKATSYAVVVRLKLSVALAVIDILLHARLRSACCCGASVSSPHTGTHQSTRQSTSPDCHQWRVGLDRLALRASCAPSGSPATCARTRNRCCGGQEHSEQIRPTCSCYHQPQQSTLTRCSSYETTLLKSTRMKGVVRYQSTQTTIHHGNRCNAICSLGADIAVDGIAMELAPVLASMSISATRWRRQLRVSPSLY